MVSWEGYWEKDNFDKNGKLMLLYRHQRFIDEGFIGTNILDIGGWGKLAYRLIQEGKNVVLIDVDKILLKDIKKRFGGELILSVGEELPLVSDVFDTVHSSETLEHVTCAEEVVREVHRVLRKGGIFCGTVPIPNEVHSRSEPGIRFFSKDNLKSLLANFKIINIEDTPSIKREDKSCSIMFICEVKKWLR